MFEVACRHGSYSEAARELHVTHSAVSQRIRQLEEELGLTLFERQGNRMVPTLEWTETAGRRQKRLFGIERGARQHSRRVGPTQKSR